MFLGEQGHISKVWQSCIRQSSLDAHSTSPIPQPRDFLPTPSAAQGYSSFTRLPCTSNDRRLRVLLLLLGRRQPRLLPPSPRAPMQNSAVARNSAAQAPQLKPKAYTPMSASRPSARKTSRALTKVALRAGQSCRARVRKFRMEGTGTAHVIRLTPMVYSASATRHTKPLTALPRRPQHARKLAKKAITSKKRASR